MPVTLTALTTLPKDKTAGALAGRIWRPDVGGPSVRAIRADGVHDISSLAPTMRDLAEMKDAAHIVRNGAGASRNTRRPPRQHT